MEQWNDGILGPFVFHMIESLQKKQTDKKMVGNLIHQKQRWIHDSRSSRRRLRAGGQAGQYSNIPLFHHSMWLTKEYGHEKHYDTPATAG